MWSVHHGCLTFDLVWLQLRPERSIYLPKMAQLKTGSRLVKPIVLTPFCFPAENYWELGAQISVPHPVPQLLGPWAAILGWGKPCFPQHHGMSPGICVRKCVFESQLFHLLAVQPWTHLLTSLSFGFFHWQSENNNLYLAPTVLRFMRRSTVRHHPVQAKPNACRISILMRKV